MPPHRGGAINSSDTLVTLIKIKIAATLYFKELIMRSLQRLYQQSIRE